MGKADRREQVIRQVTDDLLKSKFTDELGNKARVERHDIKGEYQDRMREVLVEIGKSFEETGAVPKGMQYCGSLSVHIFKSEILKTAAFATLSETRGMTFDLADGALRELTGSTFVSYGRNRNRLRSGF